ncbi:MAG: hypothetical protein RBR06_06575 [Desulfuromonadaceae bacterium]|nr:hypothetical protein [Desulfuromonadaceae bacterium]
MDKQQEKQGVLWDEQELQEKKPDFKAWVKTHKSPELWTLTWEQCLELCKYGGTLVSWEGHIIAGRDRPVERVGEKYVRDMYLHTLKCAHAAGKVFVPEVLIAEAKALGLEPEHGTNMD